MQLLVRARQPLPQLRDLALYHGVVRGQLLLLQLLQLLVMLLASVRGGRQGPQLVLVPLGDLLQAADLRDHKLDLKTNIIYYREIARFFEQI